MELLREALPWLVHLTPEVRPMTAAERAQLTVQQRAWTTASVLLVYLVMCQLPLYGAHGRANDPLMTQRMIMGSSQGTVMELGIAPLLTSGLVTQLMASAGMLPTPPAATGKPAATRQRVEKTLGMLVCLGQAVLYVFVSGQYGHVKTTLGTGNALLLVGQLFGAGVAVILMDEVLALGYGLHPSGVSLFVAAHVCTEVTDGHPRFVPTLASRNVSPLLCITSAARTHAFLIRTHLLFIVCLCGRWCGRLCRPSPSSPPNAAAASPPSATAPCPRSPRSCKHCAHFICDCHGACALVALVPEIFSPHHFPAPRCLRPHPQALAATVTQPQRGLHMLARVAVDRGPGLPSLSALGASALVAALAVYLRQVHV